MAKKPNKKPPKDEPKPSGMLTVKYSARSVSTKDSKKKQPNEKKDDLKK